MDRFRAYLIGYDPGGLYSARGALLDVEATRKAIEQCDCTVVAPDGLPLGAQFHVQATTRATRGRMPPTGALVRCVGHEQRGKIAILERLAS